MVTWLPGMLAVLLAGYLAVWLWMVVDCLRRRRFYPVFGHGWGTKAFWLAMLATLNPLQVAWYAIFGRLKRPERPSRWWRTALVALPALLVAGVTLAAWWGRDEPGARPLVFAAGPGGAVAVADPGEPAFAMAVGAHLAETASNHQFARTTSTSSSSRSRFSARQLVVLNQSDHPLMLRVGALVAERLAAVPGVERVVYRPARSAEPLPAEAPDGFLRLVLHEVEEGGLLPGQQDVRVVMGVYGGTLPYEPRHFYGDGMNPPLLHWSLNATLTHESRRVGLDLRGRYDEVAGELAESIAGGIEEEFAKWAEAYGRLPALPPAFYGRFVDRPLPEPLESLARERWVADAGLMLHHRQVWRGEAEEAPLEALASLRAALEAAGWRIDSESGEIEAKYPYLRASRGNEVVEVWRPRPDREPFGAGAEAEPRGPTGLVLAYTERFSREDVSDAVAELAAGGADAQTLLIFEQAMGPEARRQLVEQLERAEQPSLEGALYLARHHRRDEPERAERALRRADVLRWTVRDDDADEAVRDLAEEMGLQAVGEGAPPPEALEAAGIAPMGPGGRVEREVGLGERVSVYGIDEEGAMVVATVRVEQSAGAGGEPALLFHHLEKQRGSSSWGHHGLGSGTAAVRLGSVGAQATVQEVGEGRFRVVVEGGD